MSELDQRIKEMQGLRVRELRAQLESLGLSTAGRVDRESLVELLETEGRRLLSLGHDEGTPDEQAKASEPTELPPEVQEKMQELRALKARDLRKELSELGLNCEGRVDKDSLLDLLEAQGPEAILHPPQKEKKKEKETNQKQKNPFNEEKKPPTAAKPEVGKAAEARIFMLRAVSQFPVDPHSATRIITVDLEVGMSPLRFVVDTASYHSIMKESLAQNLFQARFEGEPEWAQESAPGMGIRQVAISKAFLADGKIPCGEVKVATMPGDIPDVPTGTAGILGLDFVSLFDWDFDILNEKVKISSAPKDRRAPVPFDVDGMIPVSLTQIVTPTGAKLYACNVKAASAGDDIEDPSVRFIQGLADLAAPHTLCNKAAAKFLRPKASAKAQKKKATGFGESVAMATSKKSSGQKKRTSKKTEQVDIVLGIGKKGSRLAVREGKAWAGGALEAFEVMGLTEWPTVLLGGDVLAQERIVLSFRQNKMWLPPRVAGGGVSSAPIDV